MVTDSFKNSYLVKHPRRTCDAFAWATLQWDPWQENCLPEFSSLKEYHDWLTPHLEEERSLDKEGFSFSGNPLKMPEIYKFA